AWTDIGSRGPSGESDRYPGLRRDLFSESGFYHLGWPGFRGAGHTHPAENRRPVSPNEPNRERTLIAILERDVMQPRLAGIAKPRRVRGYLVAGRSQSFTLPSALPAARILPSGENATEGGNCVASTTARTFPVAASRSCMSSSYRATARTL